MAKGGSELLRDRIAHELLASNIPRAWRTCGLMARRVWFHWNGSELVMSTFGGGPKLRALCTGHRVAVAIDTNDPPNRMLSIRGPVHVSTVDGVVPEHASAAIRYLGAEYAERYI